MCFLFFFPFLMVPPHRNSNSMVHSVMQALFLANSKLKRIYDLGGSSRGAGPPLRQRPVPLQALGPAATAGGAPPVRRCPHDRGSLNLFNSNNWIYICSKTSCRQRFRACTYGYDLGAEVQLAAGRPSASGIVLLLLFCITCYFLADVLISVLLGFLLWSL